MIKKGSDEYKRLFKTNHFFRFLELFFLGIFCFTLTTFVYIIWKCQQFCGTENDLVLFAIRLIQFCFIFGSFVFVGKIITTYFINDTDPKPEYGFTFGMFFIFLSLLLYGIFMPNLSFFGSSDKFNYIFSIVQSVLFLTSTAMLLGDKSSWHQTSKFVKTKIALLLVFMAILLVAPGIALVSSVLIIPALVFSSDNRSV